MASFVKIDDPSWRAIDLVHKTFAAIDYRCCRLLLENLYECKICKAFVNDSHSCISCCHCFFGLLIGTIQHCNFHCMNPCQLFVFQISMPSEFEKEWASALHLSFHHTTRESLGSATLCFLKNGPCQQFNMSCRKRWVKKVM